MPTLSVTCSLGRGGRGRIRVEREPWVIHLIQREDPAHQPRLGVLNGAVEHLVVVEVEIDYATLGIDS